MYSRYNLKTVQVGVLSYYYVTLDFVTYNIGIAFVLLFFIVFLYLQGFRPGYRDSHRWTKQGSKTTKHYCIPTWPFIKTRFKSFSIHPNVLRCSKGEPRACSRWIHNNASCCLSRATWVCTCSFEGYELGKIDMMCMILSNIIIFVNRNV